MPCSDEDYAFLRELVLHHSANYIDPSRNALFETRLRPIARVAGAADLESFVHLLRTTRPAGVHRAVAEAMMINETSFFRDVAPFDLLRRRLLPELIERRRPERSLRIWSAASSTGQEAYSLAMLLAEHFPELADWRIRIVATDISQQSREYGKRGRYRRMEVNRGLPARLLIKYFERDGDDWQISPAIASLVEFQPINLCTPLPPSLPRFDLVLLRNVLLYFPRQDRACVLTDVHRTIREDGALLLGNAEQAEDSTDLFKVELDNDCYFYRPVPASQTTAARAA